VWHSFFFNGLVCRSVGWLKDSSLSAMPQTSHSTYFNSSLLAMTCDQTTYHLSSCGMPASTVHRTRIWLAMRRTITCVSPFKNLHHRFRLVPPIFYLGNCWRPSTTRLQWLKMPMTPGTNAGLSGPILCMFT